LMSQSARGFSIFKTSSAILMSLSAAIFSGNYPF
jgi:hypothetical protein